MAQGTIFTANDAANYLKKANKNYLGQQTWLKAYDDINKAYGGMVTDLSVAAQQQSNAALQDFSDSIANAYDASLKQRNQVLGSNLGQGFKTNLLEENDLALESAYNAYLQRYITENANIGSNLVKNVGGIYESAKKDIGNVDEQLMFQAQNTADYLNAHYDYLQYLYDKNPDFFVGDAMQDYVNREFVGGELQVTGLKNMDEIRNSMVIQSEDGGWELSDRGRDFFSQVQALGYGDDAGTTFADYLYETNSELYDWSASDNQYDATFTDSFGRATNRTGALGSIGLGENGVISDTGYEWKGGTPEENLKKNKQEPEYKSSSPLGKGISVNKDLAYYKSVNGETLVVPTKVTIKGNPKNKDNNNFRVKLGESTYLLEVAKDGKLDDDKALTEINKAVGGIENNKLYYYGDKLYISFVEDGKVELRRVQGQGGSGTTDSFSEDGTYAGLVKRLRGNQ